STTALLADSGRLAVALAQLACPAHHVLVQRARGGVVLDRRIRSAERVGGRWARAGVRRTVRFAGVQRVAGRQPAVIAVPGRGCGSAAGCPFREGAAAAVDPFDPDEDWLGVPALGRGSSVPLTALSCCAPFELESRRLRPTSAV